MISLREVHVSMGGHAFGVSVFAAVTRVGIGEAVTMLHAGEQQGWVEQMGGYYQLTDEGVAACVA